MATSNLIWAYLEKRNMNTREEAVETFANALSEFIDDTGSDNETVLNILELAINLLARKEDLEKIIREWEEIDDA